jgi:hypothetical protein
MSLLLLFAASRGVVPACWYYGNLVVYMLKGKRRKAGQKESGTDAENDPNNRRGAVGMVQRPAPVQGNGESATAEPATRCSNRVAQAPDGSSDEICRDGWARGHLRQHVAYFCRTSDPSMVSCKEEAIWDPSGKGP